VTIDGVYGYTAVNRHQNGRDDVFSLRRSLTAMDLDGALAYLDDHVNL
jgi:hypothetical protein